MRFQRVTIYCSICGNPREVTRRVRSKACADCVKELARLARQDQLAVKLRTWQAERRVPVLHMGVIVQVLDALHQYRRGVKTDEQRAKAGV